MSDQEETYVGVFMVERRKGRIQGYGFIRDPKHRSTGEPLEWPTRAGGRRKVAKLFLSGTTAKTTTNGRLKQLDGKLIAFEVRPSTGPMRGDKAEAHNVRILEG